MDGHSFGVFAISEYGLLCLQVGSMADLEAHFETEHSDRFAKIPKYQDTQIALYCMVLRGIV